MSFPSFRSLSGGHLRTVSLFFLPKRPDAHYASIMILRLLLCLAIGCSLVSCGSPAKKKDAEKNKPKTDMPDMSADVTFQAFLGRLRQAVASHDVQTVASMMTQNFGYRLNPVGEGDGVFQYWDEEVLWPQLQAVLSQRFVPTGTEKAFFMVAPPEFAKDPNFHGFRAGITPVNGTWKFAYFVTDAAP